MPLCHWFTPQLIIITAAVEDDLWCKKHKLCTNTDSNPPHASTLLYLASPQNGSIVLQCLEVEISLPIFHAWQCPSLFAKAENRDMVWPFLCLCIALCDLLKLHAKCFANCGSNGGWVAMGNIYCHSGLNAHLVTVILFNSKVEKASQVLNVQHIYPVIASYIIFTWKCLRDFSHIWEFCSKRKSCTCGKKNCKIHHYCSMVLCFRLISQRTHCFLVFNLKASLHGRNNC